MMFRLSLSKHRQATQKSAPINQLWQRWKKALGYFLFFMLVCVVIRIYIALPDLIIFPISTVQIIDPGLHVDKQILEEQLTKDINQNFFRLDLAHLKDDVLQLPWVDKVKIERKWPNRLVITIKEEVPVARWANDGLVSASGKIFSIAKDSDASALPIIFGSVSDAQEIISDLTFFQEILAPLNLQIIQAKISSRMSWEVKLNNQLILVLGRKDLQKRLQRFVRVYGTIFATKNKIPSYIDLRYTNGFAVSWQDTSRGVMKE